MLCDMRDWVRSFDADSSRRLFDACVSYMHFKFDDLSVFLSLRDCNLFDELAHAGNFRLKIERRLFDFVKLRIVLLWDWLYWCLNDVGLRNRGFGLLEIVIEHWKDFGFNHIFIRRAWVENTRLIKLRSGLLFVTLRVVWIVGRSWPWLLLVFWLPSVVISCSHDLLNTHRV